MGKFTNPKRLWFVDKDRIAIIEEVTTSSNANASGGFITVDGATSSYETIEVAKSLRIHGIGKAEHFNTGSAANAADYDSSSVGPLGQIHSQFHEALIYKAIAMGYEDPRNLNLELAQYFNMKYETIIKEANKFARSNYTRTGMVAPQEF